MKIFVFNFISEVFVAEFDIITTFGVTVHTIPGPDAFIMVIILFKFPRLWWNVALALTEPTVQRQSARHPVNLGIVVLLLMNVPPTQLLSTLRTPQLVPVLWSMKLLQLLLSQVKLSTKAGGLYSLKWWLRAFHIFIEEHQCKIVYVTCSLCFYTLQMNKCRRIQNIFEF